MKPDFPSIVNRTFVEGLDVISSLSPDGVSPTTILGSNIVSDFFEWARANYERIIVDSPPFGLVGDVISLAMLVDSAIIMCCPDRTHFRPIQHCARCLTEAGANILGVIVNDIELSSTTAFSPGSHTRYGYGGYYGYGYGYGRSHNKTGDGNEKKKEGKPKAESEEDRRARESARQNEDLADEE